MPCQDALSQWEQTVSTHLAHLSRPQQKVLAKWSYGMVLAKSCGTSSVAAYLAAVLDKSEETMRKPRREWYLDAKHKKGAGQDYWKQLLGYSCGQRAQRLDGDCAGGSRSVCQMAL